MCRCFKVNQTDWTLNAASHADKIHREMRNKKATNLYVCNTNTTRTDVQRDIANKWKTFFHYLDRLLRLANL